MSEVLYLYEYIRLLTSIAILTIKQRMEREKERENQIGIILFIARIKVTFSRI